MADPAAAPPVPDEAPPPWSGGDARAAFASWPTDDGEAVGVAGLRWSAARPASEASDDANMDEYWRENDFGDTWASAASKYNPDAFNPDADEAKAHAREYARMGPLRRMFHSPPDQRSECMLGLGTISALTTCLGAAMRWGISPSLRAEPSASPSATAATTQSPSGLAARLDAAITRAAESRAVQALELAFWGCCATTSLCIVGLTCVEPKTLRPTFSNDSPKPDPPTPAQLAVRGATQCPLCGVLRPPNRVVHHCRVCRVCVVDYDHHCGVVGRCIAKRNIPFFYGLLASGSLGPAIFVPLMGFGAHRTMGGPASLALVLMAGAPLMGVSGILGVFLGCSVMQEAAGDDERAAEDLFGRCIRCLAPGGNGADDGTASQPWWIARPRVVCRTLCEQSLQGTLLFYDVLFDVSLMPVCTTAEFVYGVCSRGPTDPAAAAKMITDGPRNAALHFRMTVRRHVTSIGDFARTAFSAVRASCIEDLRVLRHKQRSMLPMGFMLNDPSFRQAVLETDAEARMADLLRGSGPVGPLPRPEPSPMPTSRPESKLETKEKEVRKATEEGGAPPGALVWLLCRLPERARRAAYDCVMSPWTRKQLRKEAKERRSKEAAASKKGGGVG